MNNWKRAGLATALTFSLAVWLVVLFALGLLFEL